MSDNTAALEFLKMRIEESSFGDPLERVAYQAYKPLANIMQAYADRCIEQEYIKGAIPADKASEIVQRLRRCSVDIVPAAVSIGDTLEMLTGRRI